MIPEQGNFSTSWKAVPIFFTMRSNLAMVDAFLRRSVIETSNYQGDDLGFLWSNPGEHQLSIHNRSITTIVISLLFQVLGNYWALKRIRPTLEYPILEDFLRDLGSSGKFFDGMEIVRKGVFHVRSLRSWRSQSVISFDKTCQQRGGTLVVMQELRNLLYDFTEKVFLGELRIWPDDVYEELNRKELARPDLREKLESGEIEFPEYVEAILSLEEKVPGGG